MNTQNILHDFGSGLVMRRATQEDTEALIEMQIHAFANPDTGELDEYLGGWTRDMLGGKHPTFGPQDFLIVLDTIKNKIVSCVCLISQTWTMQGISFGVGRVEIVGTLQVYRRRGLVREQFRVLHEMSAERGELLQSITGIPFFYRQFGYEYAIELLPLRQTFVPQQIPELKADEPEKYRLRHAEYADLPFISDLYKRGGERSLIHCERDLKMFEYEHFHENNLKNGHTSWWDVIETIEGERAGMLMRRRYVYQGRHTVHCYELAPTFAWNEVTPFVMREVVRQGEFLENDDKKPLSKLGWMLAANHPLFQLMGDRAAPSDLPYAWYIRVPDLPAFMQRIAPVLEKRLKASNMQKHSGSLRLNFYRSGLEFKFQDGKLECAQPWRATAEDYGQSGFGNAGFPDLTFLKLLFGYRSRTELQAMFPDCIMDGDKTAALLDVLFPKQPTHILPIH